jgi:hypothetical protein
LFEILNEILSKFYSHGYQSPQSETAVSSEYVGEVPRLCSKLDDLLAGLPGHLQPDSNIETSNGSASCFCMQAKILKSRYVTACFAIGYFSLRSGFYTYGFYYSDPHFSTKSDDLFPNELRIPIVRLLIFSTRPISGK